MVTVPPTDDGRDTMRLISGRWVFPVASPPISDGAVLIRAGKIVEVGRRAEMEATCPSINRWDLGDAALLPGLVNCHTHLELSRPPQPIGNGGFTDWLVALIEWRRQLSLDSQARAAEDGARRLLRTGTTCVGEVSSSGQSLIPLLREGLRGVVYREILGLQPEEAENRLEAAWADIQAMQRAAVGSLLHIGLSPHSPYGLSEELFEACHVVLLGTRIPACIHAAESRDEVQFLATGEGPIPRLLYPAVGCTSPPARRQFRSPVGYLHRLGALAWRPLLIHAVYADREDRHRMAASGVRVAHCARSNARLTGEVAPVHGYLKEGVPVGLGTDSLASVPTLDMWEEMGAVVDAHLGRLSPSEVLEMATLGGARALNLADQVGSLEPGKRADLVAVPAGPVVPADPFGSLIDGTRGEDVLLTLVDGEVRHSRPEMLPCA
jgi:5-methylthioadenosine/S-adenosylhomocysteine deaminase